MVYITGDKHGDFKSLKSFCRNFDIKESDKIILLGDVGLNYFLDSSDFKRKKSLNSLGCQFLCVHGNHEIRCENISSYLTIQNDMGEFYQEKLFPNLLFMKDGEIYDIEGKSYLCLGGAYSVDKWYRLQSGGKWFEDEQMKESVKEYLRKYWFGDEFDYIISHTCPYKYIPREWFLSGLDQSTVDNSMEIFLDEVEENIGYDKWYCGHYHGNKTIDKIRFLYNDIIMVD